MLNYGRFLVTVPASKDAAPASRRQRFVTGLKRCLVLLACCAVVAIVLGEFGRWSWEAELFSHFMLWYAPLLLLGIWAARRRWMKALCAGMGIAVCGMLFWPSDGEEGILAAQTQRFVAYNLYVVNDRMAENVRWLGETGADVLFLTEATLAWRQALKPLSERYPHGCSAYKDSPFGLALLSRHPLRSCEVKILPGDMSSYPYIRAELHDGAVLYGVHPPPPVGADMARVRDGSLQELAAAIQGDNANVIVLGDMNITPFSPRFRQFTETTGLRQGTSRWQPTWTPGMLALDHILVHGYRAVAESGIGPWMGSDHRPVWVVW